jgi:mannose-1-phosphate guanylyltransferase
LPLIRETLDRVRGLAPESRIRILTGDRLMGPFREALEELGPDSFLVEPQARGTGPVLVWAAWTLLREDPDAIMVSLHADHAIEPKKAFRDLIRRGISVAGRVDALFTVAVPPTRPETGYGYIRLGEVLSPDPGVDPGDEIFRVHNFVEKPDLETANEYLEAGYLWNSGIFLWRASLFLEEVRAVAPELDELIPLLEKGDVDGFFRAAPIISVDEAVLERSSRVASIRATFHWDDVGSWEAVARTRSRDPDGNVLLGAVEAVDSAENIVLAEAGTVVLFGVEGLAIVRSGDIVLVADRSRTPDLKSLLKHLPLELLDPD